MTSLASFKVLIGPNVDKAAYNHLGQLQGSNEHGKGTRGAVLHRSQGIVGVHDGMNTVIHHNKPTS